jgi:membrane glycosyltransferase
VLLADPGQVKAHGGIVNILRSVVMESVFATLLAPIVMLAHCWFVLCILWGRATGWGSQSRDDRALPLWLVIWKYWPYTIIGLAAGYVLYRFVPGNLGWYAPLVFGLTLAIPLVWISSSHRLGAGAANNDLFLSPSETRAVPVLNRARELLEQRERETKITDYRQLVLDSPAVMALHLRLLEEAPPPQGGRQIPALAAAARRGDTKHFTRQDWVALLSDAQSLAAASGRSG